MKNKVYDLIFLLENSLDCHRRVLHNYSNSDLIFIFGKVNPLDLEKFDREKKCVFIPTTFTDKKNLYESGFLKVLNFIDPYAQDIFILSTDKEFPHFDLEKYEIQLKSFPIIHRMTKKEDFHMGSIVLHYSHFLQDREIIGKLLTYQNKINVGFYNIINSGSYISSTDVNTTPKIYDCFIFNDEFNMLDLRISLLKDVVDKFVLVESKQSHSGKEKKASFDLNKSKYDEYSDKIIHVLIENFPEEMIYEPSEIDVEVNLHIHWFRENFQRNEILRGLYPQNPQDDDVILISDVDEIPDPRSLSDFISQIPQMEYGYQLQKWCIWDFDRYHAGLWPGTAAVRWKTLKKTTPQEIRKNRYNQNKFHTKERYGWHCSWFGGIDAVMYKLSSFAHQELRDIPREEVLNKMTMNLDIHGHQLLIENDGFYPPIS